MLALLTSIFVSLVPRRYRHRFLDDPDLGMKRGAILSGVVQFVVCGFLLWYRYKVLYAARMEDAHRAAAAAGGDRFAEAGAAFAFSGMTFVEYITQPVTFVIFYFLVESMVRLSAAVVAGEVMPTLPLQLVAWSHGFIERKQRQRHLGPRVVDVVKPGAVDYDLRIESCRPKSWTALSTIAYQDQLYEVLRAVDGPPPRRFVYLMRKAPLNKVVRGLHQYSPEETLEES
ncbi:MAG TPA: hypothetical protein VNK82_11750 [Terriglobales bacterium]|nr:hypothetical protein [Terriglobales bacterium]